MKVIFGLFVLAAIASVFAVVPTRRAIDIFVVTGLAVVGAILAGVEFGAASWRLDVLGQFLLLAPLAAATILVFCLATRRTRLAASSAATLALALLIAAPWLTAPTPASSQAPHFSLLLFNIWTWNKHPAAVRELVQNANADVVILVETSPRTSAAVGDFPDLYPYRYECVGTEDCDILIFSKTKLDVPHAERLRDDSNAYIASARMEVAGCRMTLLATHMGHPGPFQLIQARDIAHVVAGIGGARLLAGDFNGVPWGANVQTILKLTQFKVTEGLGGTFPARLTSLLALPIDHVLTSPGLAVTERHVMAPAGSDHLPVLIEIAVVDRSACLKQVAATAPSDPLAPKASLAQMKGEYDRGAALTGRGFVTQQQVEAQVRAR